MKFNGIMIIIFGLLVLLGGMIGFAKAQSVPSLIMGSVFALALVGCGGAMFKEIKLGYYIAIILSFILLGFFTYRFALTQNFIPAGFMSILSFIVLIALFLGKSPKTKSTEIQ